MEDEKWSQKQTITETDGTTKFCVLDGSPLDNKLITPLNAFKSIIYNGFDKTVSGFTADARTIKTLKDTKANLTNPNFFGGIYIDSSSPMTCNSNAGINLPADSTLNGDTIVVTGDLAVKADVLSNITILTGTTELNASHDVILINGDFLVTLPTAVGITGKKYTIKRIIVSSSGLIQAASTIPAPYVELIDGVAYESGFPTTGSGQSNESITIFSDGTNWRIMNWYIPAV